ncbi:hypothetical protein RRG08_001537 [Elysia crispata]|uniref:Uncharacterized protein n=1 Tax=Elysia crispata TaxID=231223 RepID=A0AAE1AK64_9GAST|nr:hypothetical protein RRG08_001537 [Elysia crispata]
MRGFSVMSPELRGSNATIACVNTALSTQIEHANGGTICPHDAGMELTRHGSDLEEEFNRLNLQNVGLNSSGKENGREKKNYVPHGLVSRGENPMTVKLSRWGEEGGSRHEVAKADQC